MNHSSASTVSLALCTFANIASEEMARDLVTEIERCLGSGNAYIRKKAALAALRCLYKVPELVDHFEGRATSLLSDRNHGVLLTGVTLVTEMVRLVGGDPFRKVRLLPAFRYPTKLALTLFFRRLYHYLSDTSKL